MRHPNFYESIKEAEMRLVGCVVMYDGEPYYVVRVSDHVPDGKFRIYLDKLGHRPDGKIASQINPDFINALHYIQMTLSDPTPGQKLDDWIDKNPNSGVIRKFMTSRKFDDFKPFPLGMVNIKEETYYVERQPTRHTQQGLTDQMISVSGQTLTAKLPRTRVNVTGIEMYHTIMNKYPDMKECLEVLKDPAYKNEALGFHRNFSFIKGPCDILFLGYKTDVVGVLPNSGLDQVRLAKGFKHIKESVQNLGAFSSVIA